MADDARPSTALERPALASDEDARRFVALCIGKRNVIGLTYYATSTEDGIGPTVTLSVREVA